MTRFRGPRALRPAALIACLGLFLLGSNYCLLSGWAGNGDMACLAVPAPEAPLAGCGRCKGDAETGDGAQRSCCPPPVVAPATPAPEKTPAAVTASLIAAAALAAPAPALAAHDRPAASESPPPRRLARAPLPARAPPLA